MPVVECPWTSLTADALTEEQMFWLVDTITSKVSTAAELSKQLGLKPRLLYKLKSSMRQGKVVKCSNGRPKALDKAALGRIKATISSSAASGGITNDEIKATIAEEYQATALRRRLEPESLKAMSARTRKRYLDLFLAYKDLVGSNNYSSLAELLTADV
ncbi:hypothetical protein B484DRAFT_449631 [Ochromonadaceae sp. CCMP2298]|nr:hypothetical protein B484DRAFT_449631 [Ochromonadaceae sp. CCMP2298]|mmetsp:Transcript_29090/g.64592  ORF Transcript_29090/g.64592 Transcript_29090/m.64592 type:complete len:159 (-) Transcript_29090:188-664(-)